MISQETFMGGAEEIALTGNYSLVKGNKRVICLTANAGGRYLRLPDAQGLEEGGPHFYLLNLDPSDWIFVCDNGWNNLHTLNAGKACEIALADNSSQNGKWFIRGATIGT